MIYPVKLFDATQLDIPFGVFNPPRQNIHGVRMGISKKIEYLGRASPFEQKKE